ncbi:MAG: MotB family protein [Granulosicoccaceae bacterium]
MEEDDCPACPQLPGWLATFADLMSLLMCFFVLLLSFSEMDVQKYKRVAGSLKFAFGVQREVSAKDPPKGTSIVAQEFSPAKPQPTIVNVVQQVTTQHFKQNLDFTDTNQRVNDTKSSGAGKGKQDTSSRVKTSREALVKPLISEGQIKRRLNDLAKNKAEEVKRLLRQEIKQGLLEVVADGDKVIVRMRERGFFQTGRADISLNTEKVLKKVANALAQISGDLVISGHTDNVPISNDEFKSNWELSSARAANVVHYMSSKGGIEPKRMEIRAHADVRPLVDNDNAKNRASNRRVEIEVQSTTSEEDARRALEDVMTPEQSPQE